MNYADHYHRLVSKASMREQAAGVYYEVHHVLPKCLGGSNEPDNLVNLTPEEHYTAHLLLVRIHPAHKGLAWAAIRMCGNTHGQRSNKVYGWLRRRHAAATSERMRGNTLNTGRTQPAEERDARSKSLTGRKQSPEHVRNAAQANRQSVKRLETNERKKQETAARREADRLVKANAPKQKKVAWNKGLKKTDHPGLHGIRKIPNSPEAFQAMWATRRAKQQKES